MHQVTHQANTVEVLGDDTVAFKLHRIDRTGQARAFGQFSGVGKSVEFERGGDVQATTAVGAERIDGRNKLPQRAFDGRVIDLQARRFGEHALDLRGLAV